MKAFQFKLIYPLIFLTASLPFRILYLVSDFLYYILRLSGYRRKVVMENLKNSFPEKKPLEIKKLCDLYYQYLCDLILETLKTLTWTEKEARERSVFHNQPWLDEYYNQKRSIIVVMGHYGNWEWAGPGFALNTKFPLVVIYRPLSNIYFEKMTSGMRTRFGSRIVPVNQTLREMVANRNNISATALIADQAAAPESSQWITFLNQDTSVFTGPEKLAKKFNYPVVYMNVKRVKRGYYETTPELLFDQPKETSEGEITEVFTRRLEKEIMASPVTWLWSHKRWKHKRREI